MDLQISSRKVGNVAVLDLRGRVLIGESNDALRAELYALVENSVRDVLVNLSDVTQIDSSGISTLVKTFVTLRRDGGNMKILNPNGFVRDVLEVTGLIRCFPTFADEATALASFRDSVAHA